MDGDVDTALARTLLDSGRLSLEVLRAHLDAARAARGGPTLAQRLVAASLLDAAEVGHALDLVRAGAGAQSRATARFGRAPGIESGRLRVAEAAGTHEGSRVLAPAPRDSTRFAPAPGPRDSERLAPGPRDSERLALAPGRRDSERLTPGGARESGGTPQRDEPPRLGKKTVLDFSPPISIADLGDVAGERTVVDASPPLRPPPPPDLSGERTVIDVESRPAGLGSSAAGRVEPGVGARLGPSPPIDRDRPRLGTNIDTAPPLAPPGDLVTPVPAPGPKLAGTLDAPAPAAGPRAAEDLEGQVLGGHRLVSRLGAGTMGTVYLAEEASTGARRALKTLPLGADPEQRVRFEREAEAMALVGDHPGVVRVHAFGEERGRMFIVMDLCEGGDLAARLQGGPRPAAEVVSIGAALARGLAHLHSRGVLHRDVKPANVLFDAQGKPRLVDFGIARLADRETLTRTGALVGTPYGMAPEQATGRACDARTDVYGLGALLYQALTGRPPLDGASLTELLKRIVEEPPAPPSRLVQGVPPGLEVVLLRALAKEPGERYDDATAMAVALEHVAAGRRVSGRRGRKRIAGIAAGALLALGVGVVVRSRGEPPAARAAPSPSPSPAPAAVAPVATHVRPGWVDELAARVAIDPPRAVLAAIESRWTPELARDLAPLAGEALAAVRPGDPAFAQAWSARAVDVRDDEALRASLRDAATIAAGHGPFDLPAGRASETGDGARRSCLRALDELHRAEVGLRGGALDVANPDPWALERLAWLDAALRAGRAANHPAWLGRGVRRRVQQVTLDCVLLLLTSVLRWSPEAISQGRAVVEAARALEPGPDSVTFEVVHAWLDIDQRGSFYLAEHAPALLAAHASLPERHEPTRLIALGVLLRAVPREDPALEQPGLREVVGVEAVEARLRRFVEGIERSGLVDAEGMPAQGTVQWVGSFLRHAQFTRSHLAAIHAWRARGTPEAAARAREALAAAQGLTRFAGGQQDEREHALRAHLLAQDVKSARASLGSRRIDRRDYLLALEVELLAGDLEAASAWAEQISTSPDSVNQPEAWVCVAAFEARRGDLEAAERAFGKAAEAQAVGPNPTRPLIPWRTVAATRRELEGR